jgi:hypothetical protein
MVVGTPPAGGIVKTLAGYMISSYCVSAEDVPFSVAKAVVEMTRNINEGIPLAGTLGTVYLEVETLGHLWLLFVSVEVSGPFYQVFKTDLFVSRNMVSAPL